MDSGREGGRVRERQGEQESGRREEGGREEGMMLLQERRERTPEKPHGWL